MSTPPSDHRGCGTPGGPSTTTTTSSSSSSSSNNSTPEDRRHRHMHAAAEVEDSHPSRVGMEEGGEEFGGATTMTYYAEITTTVSDFHRRGGGDATTNSKNDRRDEFRRESSCSSYGSILSFASASDLSGPSSLGDGGEDEIVDAMFPIGTVGDVEAGGEGGRRRSSLMEGCEEEEEDDDDWEGDPLHARHPAQRQHHHDDHRYQVNKYSHYVQCSTGGNNRHDAPSSTSQQQRPPHRREGVGSTAAAIAAASASSRRRALLCLMGMAFFTVNALVRFVAARNSSPPSASTLSSSSMETVAAESDFPSSPSSWQRQQWNGDAVAADDAGADGVGAVRTDVSLADTPTGAYSSTAAAVAPSLQWNEVEEELQRRASPYWDNLADVTEHLPDGGNVVVVPFFFHVMRCGGAMLENVLAICGGLTVAAQAGSTGGRGDTEELQVVQMPSGGKYVNVDLTTTDGVARAARLDLGGPVVRPDVMISPHPYEVASTIFDATRGRRGRMFAIFRHPMERAASLFAFKRSPPAGDDDEDGVRGGGSANDTARDPRLAGMTLEQYADSEFVENNWMVRFLTNTKTEKLSKEHLHLAREILRRKCLVGLLSELEESMERFERYFGWTFAATGPRRECRDYLLEHGENRNTVPVPQVEEGSEAWNLLMRHNTLDIELYSYVLELFEEQGKLFSEARNG